MGVTRKERLLKAMLNDNAEACRGGVSREERIIASVSKKVCDNDALEGGGTGGGGSGGSATYINLSGNADDGYTADKTFDEVNALYENGAILYLRQTDPDEGILLIMPLVMVAPGTFFNFSAYDGENMYTFFIMPDGVMSM